MSRIERHISGKKLTMDGYTIYYTDGAKFMTWASDLAHAKKNSTATNPHREIAWITRTYSTEQRQPAAKGELLGEPIWAKEENYLYDRGEVAAIMNITEYNVEKLIHYGKLAVTEIREGEGNAKRFFTRQQIEEAMKKGGKKSCRKKAESTD